MSPLLACNTQPDSSNENVTRSVRLRGTDSVPYQIRWKSFTPLPLIYHPMSEAPAPLLCCFLILSKQHLWHLLDLVFMRLFALRRDTANFRERMSDLMISWVWFIIRCSIAKCKNEVSLFELFFSSFQGLCNDDVLPHYFPALTWQWHQQLYWVWFSVLFFFPGGENVPIIFRGCYSLVWEAWCPPGEKFRLLQLLKKSLARHIVMRERWNTVISPAKFSTHQHFKVFGRKVCICESMILHTKFLSMVIHPWWKSLLIPQRGP